MPLRTRPNVSFPLLARCLLKVWLKFQQDGSPTRQCRRARGDPALGLACHSGSVRPRDADAALSKPPSPSPGPSRRSLHCSRILFIAHRLYKSLKRPLYSRGVAHCPLHVSLSGNSSYSNSALTPGPHASAKKLRDSTDLDNFLDLSSVLLYLRSDLLFL
jgi:hypothetical protein